MAIVIEEDKGTSHSPAILGWVVIIGVLVAAGYYLFLAPPPTVDITPPSNYATIAPIAQINFDPSRLVNSPAFQALTSSIAEPTSTGPAGVGRQNPFVAP